MIEDKSESTCTSQCMRLYHIVSHYIILHYIALYINISYYIRKVSFLPILRC